VAWVSFAVIELVLTAGDLEPLGYLRGFGELAGLAVVGLLHAAFASDDWRGSAFWPGLLGMGAIVWRMLAEGVRLAFSTAAPLIPLAGLGMILLAWLVVRLLDRLLWRRIPAVLLSIVGPIVLHVVMHGAGGTIQTLRPTPRPTADKPPIVIVSVDTLRSDDAMRMESVRRLGARGAVWPRATAASSWTWPSIVTLWSGVAAETHGSGRVAKREHRLEGWSEDLPWLPRELRDAGYVNVAFVTNPLLRRMPLAPSFDSYRHGAVVGVPLALTGFPGGTSDAGDARDVVDAAIDWLEDAPKSGFLLWVHLFDPHLPYRHATEHAYTFNLLRRVKTGNWFMLEDEREAVRQGYREEVAYVDAELMRLIEVLEGRGHFDDGVVVLTSDHGEELWEHGGFEHGHSHHGEVVDVPLVLVAPGVTPGERPGVAALQDVAPTLRAISGLPPGGLDLRSPIPPERVAHAFGNLYYRPMHSARVGSTRVIVDGERILAYDLVADPLEQFPEILSATELETLIGPRPSPAVGTSGREYDLEGQALRSLGYVQ
jgi:hypothetical protein